MAVSSSQAINKALGEPLDQLSESATRRINNAAEEMVEYMLFSGEAEITEPIKGNSGFSENFVKNGLRDSKGRSLRDLDLTRRIFRYPCSYMIYTDAFDNMPTLARERILARLWEVLNGKDTRPAFAHLSPDDRKNIFEILTATKKNLPAWWTSGQGPA
jgi:hypothetical protein